MAQRRPQQPAADYDVPTDLQEIYVDSMRVGTGLYGSTIFLGTLRQDQPPLVKAVVKVSPQMLKVMGLIISKHARSYEQQFGPIGLPNELLHDLGLEEEIK